ncbi:MAG TPA: DUF1295 domain-containing protein [Roseimicrobium sp.]|nr:DUF1295 domain-containing protein [Roseimicrobium sp.]
MPFSFFQILFAGLIFSLTLMSVIWWISVRIKNAGIVDIAWSAGFAALALIYAFMASGDPVRRWWMAAMAMAWSLRLGGYLYVRVMGHHPVEDRRYAQLRQEWGAAADRKMFWFFQLQGALQVVLSVPFLLAALDPSASLGWLEWTGATVWLVALVGESLSDAQLKRFKANPTNRGGVCREGLWAYSRHPNYFFEWLVWVGFFLFASASPWGWITLYCPALMLHFLLKVTGIPMTEELAVRTKGAAYIDYQKTTSRFFPWFPKRNGASSS